MGGGGGGGGGRVVGMRDSRGCIGTGPRSRGVKREHCDDN